MQFEVRWFIDNRMIYVQPTGPLRVRDIAQMSEQILALLEQSDAGPGSVHVIVDMLNVDRLPVSITDVQNVVRHLQDPALGWMLMLTKKQYIRLFCSAVTQITNTRFRTFESLDELLDFISGEDASVQPLVYMKRLMMRA